MMFPTLSALLWPHWRTLLRFGDAHPWFLPSVAAILTLLGAGYKSAAWARRVIHSWRERWDDNLLAGYLARQVNPGPFEPDKRGLSSPVQKDCSSIEIAEALRIKPAKARGVITRLQSQGRVKQRKNSDMWSATDYQMRQPIGRWVKMWLDHLERKNDKLKKKEHT
jgi:hypothetical protein